MTTELSGYEKGSRVLAIKSGSVDMLYVYGEGIYIGDLPMPGSDGPIPEDECENIRSIIAEQDAVPIKDSWQVEMFDHFASQGIYPENGATRESIIESVNAERARPMEDRIRQIWDDCRLNPCIYLDSGDTVWGYQCWWGPAEKFKVQYPDAKRIVVPVPEGNERWM